jgi:hypothetical protein
MDEPTLDPFKRTKSTKTPQQRKQEKIAWISIAFLAVVIGLIVIGSNSKNGSGGGKAQYSASSTGITVIDPATVSVSFQVTNNGKASGQPWCTINAQDPSDSHTGSDMFQLSNSLSPGQTTNSADSITITGQGAANVTTATVSCQ